METDLVAAVEQRVNEIKLADPGDVIIAAVSGGPDSVALLHVLFRLTDKYHWTLVVAHVNHQFRGDESDAEADFVAEVAAGLGLPCEIGVIDVPAYIEEASLNGQAAAREKRYEFLHQVADKYGAHRIALAHHADDQAETILMRILRGTGPSGLVGMPERRREKKVELIRPFLRIYKSDIVNYCTQHEITYCNDSSNELRKYFRNRIRLDVMPMLRQYNEQLPESLNRLTDMMQAEDDYLAVETEKVFRQIITFQSNLCRFERCDFTELHVALQRRLIKLILNCLCVERERLVFTRIERVRELISRDLISNQVLQVDEQVYIVREYGSIQFQTFAPEPKPYAYEIEAMSRELYLPEFDAKLICSWMSSSSNEKAALSSTATDVFLDLDQVAMPLVIRSRRSGDRLEPFGLNGSKKVKDMFIDAKMPSTRREVIPLLVDAAGRILWIAGFRRSKHALVEPDTERVLHMKLVLQEHT
ncbi:tRNA lysidine(34) synthetase TilS [Paenibacillus pectinilyticus]|uniref:tRNA(Ile)-lysidine synthase n=1 Tax=Paenibacillus pectinilyticus TaxID=512399 RepID=A0A1C0ZYR6_9BACL|nr:tRNA lysidine(34) synthetase TilS [Paenibacillus pectinilyticus]OCT13263.1 tRNA lysidine(34) synthetase TilS [Paenibacillus pectinilyticus]